MKRLKLTLSLIIAVIMMAMCPQSVLADEVTLSFSNGTLSDYNQSITVTDASTGISVTAYHSCPNGGFSSMTPDIGYLLFDDHTSHDGEHLSLSVSNGETGTVTNVTINCHDGYSKDMGGTGPFDIPIESRELEEGVYDTRTYYDNITSVTVTYDSTEPQLNVTLNDNSSTKTNLKDISNITWTEGGNRSTTITPSSASQLQDGITVAADYYESGGTNGWYVKNLNEDKSLTITAPEGGYLTKITMTGVYYGVGIGTLSAGTQTVDGTTITITFDPSDKVKSVTMTGSNNTGYVHEWIESATVEYYDPSYYMTITKTDATTKNIRALDIKNATVIVPDTYTGDINGMQINDGTKDYLFPLSSTITCDESKLYVDEKNVSALQNANIVFVDYNISIFNDGDDYKAIRQSLAVKGLSSDATIYVPNLKYTRSYTGNWQALYVPFALDVDALKADYDIAYIIGVRQEDTDNDGTIDYQCMDVGYMPSASKTKANYPYLIRKKSAEDDATITLTDVTIEPAVSKSVVCSTILNNYTVTGAYTETTADAMNGKYGMDNDGSLCLCDGTSALKPQRWAMAVESRGDTPYTIVGGAGAKSIMIHVIGEDDDTATGISSVEYDQSSTANCYNIAGQRVKSNAKGLVIKNGKKYLNK